MNAPLVELVERATGPDRILDAQIARDVAGLCLHGCWHSEGPDGDRGRVCDDCGADSWGNLGKHGQRLNDPLPTYTASIDAALALMERVLPNHSWGGEQTGVRTGERNYLGLHRYTDGFKAHVTKKSALRPMPVVASALTAPLAIILATLRALSSQEASK